VQIERRLRSGLQRNTADLNPDVERSLASVQRRARRRVITHRAAAGLVVAAAVAVVAVVGPRATDAITKSLHPTRPAVHQTRPSRYVPSAIDGTWESAKLTEAEFLRWYRAAGGKAEDGSGNPYPSVTAAGKAFFSQLGNGTHDYAVIKLQFTVGEFFELESGDGRPWITGDVETYAVSGDQLNLTSTSADELFRYDIHACNATYTFQITGHQLHLHLLRSCGTFEAAFAATLYASFPFTKVPS
jgi:hypothetical protein